MYACREPETCVRDADARWLRVGVGAGPDESFASVAASAGIAALAWGATCVAVGAFVFGRASFALSSALLVSGAYVARLLLWTVTHGSGQCILHWLWVSHSTVMSYRISATFYV